jgi:hypothetical protein
MQEHSINTQAVLLTNTLLIADAMPSDNAAIIGHVGGAREARVGSNRAYTVIAV